MGKKVFFFLLEVISIVNGAKFDVHDLTKANFVRDVTEKPHFVMFYSDR